MAIEIPKLQKSPTFVWIASLVWVAIAAWWAFLDRLGSTGLVDETEPLFAEAARQMLETGNWVTPYFNGEPRFDKPPLLYWMMAGFFKILGTNEWAVRLPSALSAIALMVLLFYTLHRFTLRGSHWWQPTAAIGTTAFAFNVHSIVWGRIGVSDMLLSGCVGCALLCFFVGYAAKEGKGQSWLWYLAFYACMGLGVLAKGPIGLILPGLAIVAFATYMGKVWTLFWETQPLLGIPLFSAIAVPWYVLAIRANGASYVQNFFGYHNIERFSRVVNSHDAPWYFYFLVVALGFLPWSGFLPGALIRLRFWNGQAWRSRSRANHIGIFALFWFATTFGFFTVASTKLPSYVLPLMPAAAILIALLFNPAEKAPFIEESAHTPTIAFGSFLNVLTLLVLGITCFVSFEFIGYDPAAPKLDAQIESSGFLEMGGVVWSIAATFGLLMVLGRRLTWLWIVNSIAFAAFLLVSLYPISDIVDRNRQLPLRELSAAIVEARQPQEEIAMVGFKKPTVVFYTQMPVRFISGRDAVNATKDYLKEATRDRPDVPSVLLLGDRNRVRKLARVFPTQSLEESGNYRLVRVLTEREKS